MSEASKQKPPTTWLGRLKAKPVLLFTSLSWRMVAAVCAASLVTSGAVTWTSVRSIESFLGSEIDTKFPTILGKVGDRLEGWYAQRESDLATFGGSHVVTGSFEHLDENASGRRGMRAREELRTYLTYVLAQFSEFDALFVLDREGNVELWVGMARELSGEFRQQLANHRGVGVSPTHGQGGALVQVVSTRDESDPSGLSLHGLVPMEKVRGLLADDDRASGDVFVVDRGGRVLMASDPATAREGYARDLPTTSGPSGLDRYTRSDGEEVVGIAQRFDRFGWTIVVEQSYEEAFAPVVTVVSELIGLNLAIIGIFSVMTIFAARSLVGPILALSDGVLRFAEGETEIKIPGHGRKDEIGVLTRAFQQMIARLRLNQEKLDEQRDEIEAVNHRLLEQNSELQRLNEVFEQLSLTDDLTKLHNHRFFQEHMPQEMKRADRTGAPLSLILIDIDDFKKLNDRYGHSVGDAVLRRVADVMSNEVREMDLLARYGGEEFALLAGSTGLEGAVALAEKLRIAVAGASFSLEGLEGKTEIGVTVSIGVALYRNDVKAFFNDADRALYRAKEAGKDCVVVDEGGRSESSEP
jgi:diguanylate cyclase (GGDEF)-like protein